MSIIKKIFKNNAFYRFVHLVNGQKLVYGLALAKDSFKDKK
tara:strand:+ start:80 stop:202 length:123 start_codon:yes stop_codon:yes gene_type:complete